MIFQLPLNMDLRTRYSGRWKYNNLITIITFQSFSKESERNKTHTGSLPFKECSTCLRKEVLKFFQSFLSSLFPLKVSVTLLTYCSCSQHQRYRHYLNHSQDLASSRHLLRHYWRSPRPLLQTNSASAELIQNQKLKLGRQDRLQPKKITELRRFDPVDSGDV